MSEKSVQEDAHLFEVPADKLVYDHQGGSGGQEDTSRFEVPAGKLDFNHQGGTGAQEGTQHFEVPADKLVYNHQSLRESRELGDASITIGYRGKARISITGEESPARWPWALAVVIAAAALGAAWQFHLWPFAQPAPPVEPRLISAPQTGTHAPPVAVAVPPESQPVSGTLITPDQTGKDDANVPGPDGSPAPAVRKPAKPHAAADSSQHAQAATRTPRKTAQPAHKAASASNTTRISASPAKTAAPAPATSGTKSTPTGKTASSTTQPAKIPSAQTAAAPATP